MKDLDNVSFKLVLTPPPFPPVVTKRHREGEGQRERNWEGQWGGWGWGFRWGRGGSWKRGKASRRGREAICVQMIYLQFSSPWHCTLTEGGSSREGGKGHNHFYDTYVNYFITLNSQRVAAGEGEGDGKGEREEVENQSSLPLSPPLSPSLPLTVPPLPSPINQLWSPPLHTPRHPLPPLCTMSWWRNR